MLGQDLHLKSELKEKAVFTVLFEVKGLYKCG